MMTTMRSCFEKRPLVYFFSLAFLISWILWIPLLYGHFALGWTSWEGNIWKNYKTMLGLLGSLGPAIAAIIMAYVLKGKTEVVLLLKRVVQWRVKIGWWLIGLYGWWLLCSVITVLSQVADVQKTGFLMLISLVNIPAMIFILQLPLLAGMFGEEVGWRGFALPRLLEKFNPVTASLIIVLPWLLWHAPLAVFQEWRGNASLFDFFLRYFLLIVPLSVIFTWFFQKTQGSLLLVIVLHKSFNLTFNAYKTALGLDEQSFELIRQWSIVALWILAFAIVIYYIKLNRKKILRVQANTV